MFFLFDDSPSSLPSSPSNVSHRLSQASPEPGIQQQLAMELDITGNYKDYYNIYLVNHDTCNFNTKPEIDRFWVWSWNFNTGVEITVQELDMFWSGKKRSKSVQKAFKKRSKPFGSVLEFKKAFWSGNNRSGVLFLLNLAKLIDFGFGVEISTIKVIQV